MMIATRFRYGFRHRQQKKSWIVSNTYVLSYSRILYGYLYAFLSIIVTIIINQSIICLQMMIMLARSLFTWALLSKQTYSLIFTFVCFVVTKIGETIWWIRYKWYLMNHKSKLHVPNQIDRLSTHIFSCKKSFVNCLPSYLTGLVFGANR